MREAGKDLEIGRAARDMSVFFDVLPDFVCILDTQGRILSANLTARQILGFDEGTELPGSFNELIHPDDREAVRERFRHRIETGERVQTEVRIRSEDGSYIPFEVIPNTVREGGEILLVCRGRDLRPHKDIEQSLRVSETRYRSLVSLAPDAIFSVDSNGSIVLWNRAAKEIFGYSVEEVLGKPVTLLIPDAKVSLHNTAWESTVGRGRKPKDGTFRQDGRRKSGEVFPVEMSLSQWSSASGVFFTCIARDITEQVRAETALKESEDRYRSIVEHAPLGIFLAAVDGRIGFINREFAGILGAPDAGEKVSYHIMKDRQLESAGAQAAFNECIRTGEIQTIEFPYLSRWGRDLFVRVKVVPIKDGSGETVMVQGLIDDITSNMKVMNALERSEERFRSVAEGVYDGLIILENGKVQFTNKRFTEISGYSTADYDPMTVCDLAAPEEKERVTKLRDDVWQPDSKLREFSFWLARKDGGRRYVNVRYSEVIFSSEGWRRFLILKDLTEQKVAEEALRLSEERYRALAEALPDYIYIIDSGMRVVYMNRPSIDSFGANGADLIGAGVDAIFPPGVADKHVAALREVMKSGMPAHSESLGWLKSRGEVWLDTWLVPLRNAGGEVDRVLGVSRDVTERVAYQSAIAKKTAELEAVFSVVPDLYFRIRADGTFVDYKAGNAENLYVPKDMIIGRNIHDLMPPHVIEKHDRVAPVVLKTGAHSQFEYSLMMPGGRQEHFEARYVKLSDDELVVIIRDITDRIKAECAERLNIERMAALLKLGQMGSATVDEITEFAVEEAVRLTGSKVGYIAFMSDDEKVMRMNAWSKAVMAECMMKDRPLSFNVDETALLGEPVRQRRAIITNDYEKIPGRHGCPAGHLKITRHLSAPVFSGSRIVLVAAVANKADDYEDADVNHVTLLMDGLWKLIERKRAEEALLDQERYRALYERSLDCVYLHTPEGVLIDANEVLLNTLGYSRGEFIDKNITSFMSSEQVPMALDTFREIEATGLHRTTPVFSLRKPDGSLIHLQIKASGVYRAGKLWAIQSVARDITRRVKAEESLRESEMQFKELSERHRKIIDSSPDAIVASDLEGRITDCNWSALYLFGFQKREEMIGRVLFDFFTGNERGRVVKDFAKLGSEGALRNLEYHVRRRSGEEFPTEMSASALRDFDGAPVGSVLIIKDISERRRLHEQLVQTEKLAAVGTLMAGLSHEINNPIGVILGYAQSMLRRVSEGDPLRKPLQAVEREAVRCGNLVRALLDFSRKPAADRAPIEVKSIMQSVYVLGLEKAIKMNVEIEADPGLCGDTLVLASQIEMESALFNIVDNAIDACQDGGRITIYTEPGGTESGPGVWIHVTDNGVGIKPENISRIFEPFYTTKPVGRGTGLGLSLSRQLIETGGGRISVTSNPGAGTVVSVWLPLAYTVE